MFLPTWPHRATAHFALAQRRLHVQAYTWLRVHQHVEHVVDLGRLLPQRLEYLCLELFSGFFFRGADLSNQDPRGERNEPRCTGYAYVP